MTPLVNPKPRHERLREAREAAEMTQEDWARSLEISVVYVGKLERGERSPSGGLLRRIAIHSGKSMDWFYEGEAIAV